MDDTTTIIPHRLHLFSRRLFSRRRPIFLGSVLATLVLIPLLGLLGFDKAGEYVGLGRGLHIAHGFNNFPMRNDLIKAHNLLLLKGLGVMPGSTVLGGRDGWWFYPGELFYDSFIADTHLRENPLAPEEVKQLSEALERLATRLKAQGTTFLFVIAPDKQTVYPEHLPEDYGPLAVMNRRTQFLEYWRAHTADASYMLDLTDEMRANKSKGQLYYKTDAHWNALGRDVAYHAIFDNLAARGVLDPAEKLGPPAMKEYRISGDMVSGLLGLGKLVKETALEGNVQYCSLEGQPIGIYAHDGVPFSYHCLNAPQRNAVMFHDSFFFAANGLWQYLSHHFSNATAISHLGTNSFDNDSRPILPSIWQPKPDVVIIETVERCLRYTLQQIAAMPLPPEPHASP